MALGETGAEEDAGRSSVALLMYLMKCNMRNCVQPLGTGYWWALVMMQ